MSEEQKFRLVTRSDFDGLVCAVLLEDLEMIDDILFVHPNDMQQGRVTIQDTDITTNLPYISGVHLAFDHHESEVARAGELADNHIIDADAPSAARVVYDHYGGKETFPKIDEALMAEVIDSRQASAVQNRTLCVTQSNLDAANSKLQHMRRTMIMPDDGTKSTQDKAND